MTTGNNTVRFNPNFYKTGKVKKIIQNEEIHVTNSGVSFNSWHLGGAILEPCTLTLFTPHLHSGASFSFCI